MMATDISYAQSFIDTAKEAANMELDAIYDQRIDANDQCADAYWGYQVGEPMCATQDDVARTKGQRAALDKAAHIWEAGLDAKIDDDQIAAKVNRWANQVAAGDLDATGEGNLEFVYGGRNGKQDQRQAQPVTSADSERALVAALLVDPPQLNVVTTMVSGADFADPDMGALFDHLVVLHQARIPISDPRVLVPELLKAGLPRSVTEMVFIATLNGEGVGAHCVFYAREVARLANLRRQQDLATQWMIQTKVGDADPDALAAWVDARLADLRAVSSDQCATIGQLADEYLADLLNPKPHHRPVMTGFERMDNSVGGWLPGELITLAARPGLGKTAWGAQVARFVAAQRPVLLVSLEMRGTELVARTLAGLAGVNSRRLRAGRGDEADHERLCQVAEGLRDVPLHIWSPPAAKVSEIIARGKRLKAAGDIALLVVDYIGLISADDPRRPRWESVGHNTRQLKQAAKVLECPVLALCQLNRDAQNSRPELSHLRDSGSVEQDSDVVLFLHREKPDEDKVELRVAKHRHSACGKFPLRFIGAESRFESERPEYSFPGYED